MFEDNQPAVHVLLKNPTHSGRSKHMDIKIKICGEVLAKREKILLKYIPTKFNLADIFTKPLQTVQFRELRTFFFRIFQKSLTILKALLKHIRSLTISSPRHFKLGTFRNSTQEILAILLALHTQFFCSAVVLSDNAPCIFNLFYCGLCFFYRISALACFIY